MIESGSTELDSTHPGSLSDCWSGNLLYYCLILRRSRRGRASVQTACSQHANFPDQHVNSKLDALRASVLRPAVVLLHLSGAPDLTPECQINRSFIFESLQTGTTGQDRQGQT